MTCWAERYAGQPADTSLALNCTGLASRILREQFGKDFPNLLGILRAAYRGSDLPMTPAKKLRDGVLVVLGTRSNPVRHVGVYCAAADRVVHAVTDIPDGVVRCELLSRLKHEWTSVLYYEVL